MNPHWAMERRGGQPLRPHSLSVSVLADSPDSYAKRREYAQEYTSYPPRPSTSLYPPSSPSYRHEAGPPRHSHSPPMSASLPRDDSGWSHMRPDHDHRRHSYMQQQAPHPHLHHPYSSHMDHMTSNAARPAPKQSGRHQRKRSAGCLNCHTVWSPTWRKDTQGQMRCNACGLYLAARGQERPLTLVPKKKGSGEEVGTPNSAMLSPLPRDSPRYAYGTPNESHGADEGSYPFPAYYPPHDHSASLRPSPSYSYRSLGASPGDSSCYSGYTTDTRDLLSPAHSKTRSSSPNTSPLSFSEMSLDPSRRLPLPHHDGANSNSLGLKGLGRRSSSEYTPLRANKRVMMHMPAPLTLSPEKPQWAATPEAMALSPVNEAAVKDGGAAVVVRQTLPPLSELTRGLSSWRPNYESMRQNSFSSQDRRQTERLDAHSGRSDRLPSL